MSSQAPVWLITGTSSGLGLELAILAARRGARVVATSRSPAGLPPRLTSLGGVTPARLDHNEPLDRVRADVDAIVAVHGRVDVVVNNAGCVYVPATGALEEALPDATLAQFQANVFGPLNVYRALLPHLRERKNAADGDGDGDGDGGGATPLPPTLVTVGSMAAWYPSPGYNAYHASKAALRVLGLGLAAEVAPLGIRHCLVEPGYFRTALLAGTAAATAPAAATAGTEGGGRQRLECYRGLNEQLATTSGTYNGAQLGDPAKGAEVLYEVITSTGVAAGRPLPALLPLGSDACAEIAKVAGETIAAVDKWKEVACLTDWVD